MPRHRPACIVDAPTAVEFAINIIHPETRTHAQRPHAEFLTARNIDTAIITAHWNTIADRWPDE